MIVSIHHIKYATIVILMSSILALLALTSNVLMAQSEVETKTATLEECINMAIENNLQLAAARKRLEVANADRIKASLLFPTNPKLGSESGARESSSTGRDTDYSPVRLLPHH